jgi:magnesium chelatase subunit D
MSDAPDIWSDALRAADLLAVDPVGLGGVSLRGLPGPARDAWLAHLHASLPADAPWRRMPIGIADARLLGGLDLAATLQTGRPIAQRGLLAEADGGVLVLAMAERLSAGTAARLAATLDTGTVSLARDGIETRNAARIGLVALDEGMTTEETPPPSLLDRLAFLLDLEPVTWRDAEAEPRDGQVMTEARARLTDVTIADEMLDAVFETAHALGVVSLRATLHALCATRAAAALAGRIAATMEDAAVACRLVLAPRATRLPAPEPPDPEDQPDPPPPEERENPETPDTPAEQPDPAEILLEATRAAIPPGLLAQLREQQKQRNRAQSTGRVGALRKAGQRGRPAGIRPSDGRDGTRLNVIETLRAAAPWQRLRRNAQPDASTHLLIRRDDFRATRLQQRAGTTTIFVVDASGSAAANRLAEAKGAVELLLADCYIRRDQVAVIAFRGTGAQVLLPPTRSLVRAKRSLASLPAGGGTPLAAGIDVAFHMADGIRRRGETPCIVLLTDGRANVARDGAGGRTRAAADALTAARQIRAGRFLCLLIDTSVRPQADGAKLAVEMGARYLPLPYANATALTQVVQGEITNQGRINQLGANGPL